MTVFVCEIQKNEQKVPENENEQPINSLILRIRVRDKSYECPTLDLQVN